MQTWASSCRFKTLGDPQLERMVQEAMRFEDEALKASVGRKPRWLSFCGPSGTGKTHIASALFRCLGGAFHAHPSLLSGAMKFTWPRLLPKLRNGEYHLLDDIRDCHLLFLDDFGTERPTEFALEKLYEIIESRNRKWTILTANLSVEQIGSKMDTRIASRLIRDGSIVVNVQAPDFNLR
jgi:DNA replication protein DnaC